ncbi:MAG: SpoIIE family protein phosphatase [Candidatus Ozemobacteraceae bacterium]
MWSERSSSSRFSWIGRWCFFSFVFFGLPLLLAWLGALEIFDQQEKERRQTFQKRLDDLLSSFEERIDPAQHLSRVLRKAEQNMFRPSKVVQGPSSPLTLPPYHSPGQSPPNRDKEVRTRQVQTISALKQRYPGILEFTTLDAAGLPIPELCDFSAPRTLLRRLFLACRETRTGDARAFSRETAVISSFLGPMTPKEVFLPCQIHLAANQRKRRLVYFSEAYPEGMMIIHLTPCTDWKTLTLREHLAGQPQNQTLRLALVDLGNPVENAFHSWVTDTRPDTKVKPRNNALPQTDAIFHTAPASLPDAKAIAHFFHRFLYQPFDNYWRGDVLWMRRTLAPGLIVVGRARLPSDYRQATRRQWIGTGILAFWTLLAVASALVFSGRRSWEWNVSTSLILAFLYTAGLPILVMGLTARSYLIERRSVLEKELQNNVEKSLIRFDAGFSSFLEGFGYRMRETVRDFRLSAGASPASIATCLLPLRRHLAAYDYCAVVNASGAQVFTEMSRKALGNAADMVQAVSRLGPRILRVLDPSLREAPTSEGFQEKGEADWLFTRLVGNIGGVAPIDVGNSPCLLGLFAIYDFRSRPNFIVILFWSEVQIEREYIRRGLLEFGRRLEDTTIYAFNRDRPEWSFPARCPYPRQLRPFLPRVLSAERATKNRVSNLNDTQLLTGIRGTMLSVYSLTAVSSDRNMRHELNLLSWKLLMGGWIVLALSVAIGMLVARAFLAPINVLSLGVKALQDRDFKMRLVPPSHDEFGRLTESFNEMMEGLADLELAKVIQESLFPTEQLALDSVTVFGTCRAAGQVGGDYFEYAPIDEHSLAIVIGDVSGHGVSAALVMAMARAVFAHPASGKDPAKGLSAMNTVLLTTLKRKKMMTCLYGIIETDTRRFRFCNAGQCYPVLVREKSTKLLEQPGKPLGTGQKRSFEAITVDLQAGDWLLFSTDGLYEALDKTGEQIGYDRVLAMLPEIAGNDAREYESHIRAWHDRTAASGPFADDITLIVCRFSVSSSEPIAPSSTDETGRRTV